MISVKAFLAGLVGVSLCMADISGIVTDTGTTPISGAVVQLESDGQSVITEADGRFTLVTSSTSILHGKSASLPNGLAAKVAGNLMTVMIAERSVIEVATFDLNGKALSKVQQTMETGINTIDLPYRGAGIYLCKIKSGNREFVLKCNTIGGVSSGSSVVYQGPSSNLLAKQEMSTAAINDLITATKTGYLNYRVVVTNFDTSGIAIKMIASAGSITDADGNVYQTVRIGKQVWMVENLRTTKYNDATPITETKSGWGYISTDYIAEYCWYDNDPMYKADYGALYNCNVVATGKLAPMGWHVPTYTEWSELITCIGEGAAAAGKLKEVGIKHWSVPDAGISNETGFTALPGGQRYTGGTFDSLGTAGYFWTSTGVAPATARNMVISSTVTSEIKSKWDGYSVRCIRNPTRFTLTLSSNDNTMGTVTCSPNAASFDTAATVTITATAMGGYHFKNWTGSANGNSNPLTLTIDSDKSITAVFEVFNITDMDGNIYHTVKIGSQYWLVENLKTTKYNDGTPIPMVTDSTAWNNLQTPGYCWYNNDSTYKNPYGALYNWQSVATGKLAPDGCHIASAAEWQALIVFCGSDPAQKLKETGGAHWTAPTSGPTNSTGFTAVGGGQRYGSFMDLGKYGIWWTSTATDTLSSKYYAMANYGIDVLSNSDPFTSGFSVRCIQD